MKVRFSTQNTILTDQNNANFYQQEYMKQGQQLNEYQQQIQQLQKQLNEQTLYATSNNLNGKNQNSSPIIKLTTLDFKQMFEQQLQLNTQLQKQILSSQNNNVCAKMQNNQLDLKVSNLNNVSEKQDSQSQTEQQENDVNTLKLSFQQQLDQIQLLMDSQINEYQSKQDLILQQQQADQKQIQQLKLQYLQKCDEYEQLKQNNAQQFKQQQCLGNNQKPKDLIIHQSNILLKNKEITRIQHFNIVSELNIKQDDKSQNNEKNNWVSDTQSQLEQIRQQFEEMLDELLKNSLIKTKIQTLKQTFLQYDDIIKDILIQTQSLYEQSIQKKHIATDQFNQSQLLINLVNDSDNFSISSFNKTFNLQNLFQSVKSQNYVITQQQLDDIQNYINKLKQQIQNTQKQHQTSDQTKRVQLLEQELENSAKAIGKLYVQLNQLQEK